MFNIQQLKPKVISAVAISLFLQQFQYLIFVLLQIMISPMPKIYETLLPLSSPAKKSRKNKKRGTKYWKNKKEQNRKNRIKMARRKDKLMQKVSKRQSSELSQNDTCCFQQSLWETPYYADNPSNFSQDSCYITPQRRQQILRIMMQYDLQNYQLIQGQSQPIRLREKSRPDYAQNHPLRNCHIEEPIDLLPVQIRLQQPPEATIIPHYSLV